MYTKKPDKISHIFFITVDGVSPEDAGLSEDLLGVKPRIVDQFDLRKSTKTGVLRYCRHEIFTSDVTTVSRVLARSELRLLIATVGKPCLTSGECVR